MEQKFYICKHCGNIIVKIKDSSVPVVCCGEPMSKIVPGVTDAAERGKRRRSCQGRLCGASDAAGALH